MVCWFLRYFINPLKQFHTLTPLAVWVQKFFITIPLGKSHWNGPLSCEEGGVKVVCQMCPTSPLDCPLNADLNHSKLECATEVFEDLRASVPGLDVELYAVISRECIHKIWIDVIKRHQIPYSKYSMQCLLVASQNAYNKSTKKNSNFSLAIYLYSLWPQVQQWRMVMRIPYRGPWCLRPIQQDFYGGMWLLGCPRKLGSMGYNPKEYPVYK